MFLNPKAKDNISTVSIHAELIMYITAQAANHGRWLEQYGKMINEQLALKN